MPIQAPYKTDKLGGGLKTAQYRDALGRTRSCTILEQTNDDPVEFTIRIEVPQSTNGANVRTNHPNPNHILEVVPLATDVKDTEAVFWRQQAGKFVE